MLTDFVWDNLMLDVCDVASERQNVIGFRKASNSSKPLKICTSKKQKLLFQFVNQMVAVAFDLKPVELLNEGRGNVRKSRARQIAMYLMNVSLSRTFIEISNYYGRDRTTVSHACRVIEELRDIPSFDDRIGEFENTISLVLSLSGPLGMGIPHE